LNFIFKLANKTFLLINTGSN